MTELWILAFVLVMVRVATFIAVVPLFGGRYVPKTVKVGLALALTMMWVQNLEQLPPELIENKAHYLQWFGFFVITLREFLVGALLGAAFGLFLFPANVAGAYLAQEMGLSMASLSSPGSDTSSNIFAVLFQTIASMLFLMLDLHHFMFAILHVSFQRVGIGDPAFSFDTWSLVEAFSRIDQMGLSIIAPAGICLFAILMVLLLLTKTAPSMNLFSIGLSVRIGAGLVFLLLFLPNILNAVVAYFYWGENAILAFLDSL